MSRQSCVVARILRRSLPALIITTAALIAPIGAAYGNPLLNENNESFSSSADRDVFGQRLRERFTPGRGGGHGGLAELIRGLDLTPKQRSELRSMRGEGQPMWDRMEQLRSKRVRLFESLRDSRVTEEAIRAESRKIGEEFMGLMETRIERALKLRKILTPEQFSRLLEALENRSHARGGNTRRQ